MRTLTRKQLLAKMVKVLEGLGNSPSARIDARVWAKWFAGLKCLLLVGLFASGCVSKPSATIPSSVMPPKPHAVRKVAGAVGGVPSLKTITLGWDYSITSVSFNIHSTTNCQDWQLVTNTSAHQVVVPVRWPNEFFFVTATNAGLESISPWDP